MEANVSSVNLIGYIVAFMIMVAFFGVIRLLCRCPAKGPSVSVEQPAPPAPPAPAPLTQSFLEVAAAAVGAVHSYLKEVGGRRRPTGEGRALAAQKLSFINYWVLSERLSPAYRDDPFHREKSSR